MKIVIVLFGVVLATAVHNANGLLGGRPSSNASSVDDSAGSDSSADERRRLANASVSEMPTKIIDDGEKLRDYRVSNSITRGLVIITSDADPNVLSLPKDIANSKHWDAIDFENKSNGNTVSFRKILGHYQEVLQVLEANLQEAENVIIAFPNNFEYYIIRMKNLSDFTDAMMESLLKLNPVHVEVIGSAENHNYDFHLLNKIQRKLINGDEVKWTLLQEFVVSVSPNSYKELDLKLLIDNLYAPQEDYPFNYLQLRCEGLTNDEINELAGKPTRPTWQCIPDLNVKLVYCSPNVNEFRRGRRANSEDSGNSDFAVRL